VGGLAVILGFVAPLRLRAAPGSLSPQQAGQARWQGAAAVVEAQDWPAAGHQPQPRMENTGMALRKFIIERDIPKVGSLEREQLRGAAAKSNQVLNQLGPDIQWVESYVADNKTFCVYLAKDEAIIRKHAEISGFPATQVTEVKKMIDPTTESA
jgi:hypothetical protein